MTIPGIAELELVGTFDRGNPNMERIAIRVNQTTNMGQCALFLGVRTEAGMAIPIRDNMFWFGDGIVHPGDWLFIYTSAGAPRATDIPNSDHKLFTIFWGRKQVILDSDEIVPILVRLDGVIVGGQPVLNA